MYINIICEISYEDVSLKIDFSVIKEEGTYE